MIINPNFVIGHIGRTGGDACKQLVAALQLPETIVGSVDDIHKHRALGAGPERACYAITVRRLAPRVISFFYHQKQHWKWPEHFAFDPRATCISSIPDRDLRLMVQNRPVRHHLRQECLEPDLIAFLGKFYEMTEERIQRLMLVETKTPLAYDHSVEKHLNESQIIKLYETNPLWAAMERNVYADQPRPDWLPKSIA